MIYVIKLKTTNDYMNQITTLIRNETTKTNDNYRNDESSNEINDQIDKSNNYTNSTNTTTRQMQPERRGGRQPGDGQQSGEPGRVGSGEVRKARRLRSLSPRRAGRGSAGSVPHCSCAARPYTSPGDLGSLPFRCIAIQAPAASDCERPMDGRTLPNSSSSSHLDLRRRPDLRARRLRHGPGGVRRLAAHPLAGADRRADRRLWRAHPGLRPGCCGTR